MNNKNKLNKTFAYLLHQIWNERRSNWALLTELLIVSSIVWYIVDDTYTKVLLASEPVGYDYTNCYKFELDYLGETSIGYDSNHPNDWNINQTDLLALIDRLRHDNDIECAAYSYDGDPFYGGVYVYNVQYDTLRSLDTRRVMCEPEMLKVFRIGSTDGKSSEQLATLLKENSIMLSEGTFGDKLDIRKKMGEEFLYGSATPGDTFPRRLTAVVPVLKRLTDESIHNLKTAIVPLPCEYYNNKYLSLSVRVKGSHIKGFEERMREKIKNKNMRAGNFYICSFKSYDQLKYESEAGTDSEQRYMNVAMAFLLFNVFLGLLGTFWFRTQHRFPDIGLQKVVGATNRDIVLRLFAEAALLMTIAFIPSLIIDYNLGSADLTSYYQGVHLATGRFIFCAAITYVMMLVVIALGIWFPALRAVKARPVDVLRGE